MVVEGATLATLVAEPSPCSSLVFFLISSGSASSAGHCSRSQPMHCRSSSASPGDLHVQAGAGPIGVIVVGFVTAGFALIIGRYAFSMARSPVVRLVIGLLLALPAARAGYDATFALAHVGVPSGWWREVFAVFGAITVGCTAWAPVSILTEPAAPGGSVAPGSAQSPIGAVTKGR